jgi:uncharacterized membrane protein
MREDLMTTYTIYLAALLIGVIAGLRTMTSLAAVSWAASLGALRLEGTRLAFLGFAAVPWIFTALAIAELVTDQLPSTPSRKTPLQFAARIMSGAVCGAAIATGLGERGVGALLGHTTQPSLAIGLIAGVIGAILGTLVGSGLRARLAHAFRRDRPAAFLEDAVAVAGAVLIVGVLG